MRLPDLHGKAKKDSSKKESFFIFAAGLYAE